MYNIYNFKDTEFNDKCWLDFYELLKILKKKYKTAFTTKDWKDLKNRFYSLIKNKIIYDLIILYKSGKPIAFADYRAYSENSPDQKAYFNIQGDFDQLPAEVEKEIIKFYIDSFEKVNVDSAFGTFYNDHLQKLVSAWNATKLSRQDQYYLYHDKVNSEILEKWLDQIPQNNPGLEIKFLDKIHDEMIPKFVAHFNNGLADMPEEESGGTNYTKGVEDFRRQQKMNEQNNIVKYDYLIMDNNKIAGLTDVYVNRNNTESVHQILTYVEKNYRGKGLSKWLKAKMYFKIRKDFPNNKAIITEMRAINDPILHINDKIGFILERAGSEYRIELGGLKLRYSEIAQ